MRIDLAVAPIRVTSRNRLVAQLAVLLYSLALPLAHAVAAGEPSTAAPAAAPLTVAELCVPLPEPDKVAHTLDRKEQKLLRGLLEEAGTAYQSNDYVRALTALRSAYRYQSNGDVVYNVAQACREAGQDLSSLALYEQSQRLDLEPSLKNDCKRHIEELKSKLAKDEDDSASRLLSTKEYDAAIAAWDRAFKYKEDAVYIYRQAEAYQQADQPDKALEAYERFVLTDPNQKYVTEAKKKIASMQAKKEDQRALQLMQTAEHLKAANAWDNAYRLDPQAIYLFRGAEAFNQATQQRDAQAGYTRFLRECPPTEWIAEQIIARDKLSGQKPKGPPIYKNWRFWAAIGGGAAVIGTAIGVGIYLSKSDPLANIPLFFQRTID
jgi:tetratricopeptide (TPR) repeat protein